MIESLIVFQLAVAVITVVWVVFNIIKVGRAGTDQIEALQVKQLAKVRVTTYRQEVETSFAARTRPLI